MTVTEQNICRFVPRNTNETSLHPVHFVLETQEQTYGGLRLEALYKMYYVISGRGQLHTQGEIRPLRAGDVFFSFPAEPFAIESVEDFRYMYISFLGARGNMLMEKLGISPQRHLFSDCHDLETVWRQGIDCPPELSDMAGEGVLLLTFAYLGGRMPAFAQRDRQSGNAVSAIKRYLDERFSDPGFSLDNLSKELKYNKKYLSTVFKKHMGVGIVEYLNTVRVQHACTMIRQGFTSVSDVALRCGYPDAQYFSKVFKRKLGMSPRAYIEAVRSDGHHT